MSPGEQQQSLDDSSSDRAKKLDKEIAAFAAALALLLGDWKSDIEAMLSEHVLALDGSTLMTFLSMHVPVALQRLHYSKLIQETVATYQDSIEAVEEMLRNAGIDPAPFLLAARADLQALRQSDVNSLSILADEASSNITRSVLLGTIGNQTSEEMLADITRHIETFESHANAIVDTGMVGADRYVAMQVFVAAGMKYFRYFGPLDERTRPFCREHVGEIKTVPEWDALDSGPGQPRPIHIWLGGWRCRHMLVPELTKDGKNV